MLTKISYCVKESHMTEKKLTYVVLYILDKYGSLPTANLKAIIKADFSFEDDAYRGLKGRKDTVVDQLIRNIVSHRTHQTNIIFKNWVVYESKLLSITPLGIEELKRYLLGDVSQ